MHNGAWEAILRQIPPEQQDQYMLVTASGIEIALQCFLRIESELVIVKGRLSGSQEQGRIFFIPYTNIDYIGTAKPIKDSEFHDVFGSLSLPAPPAFTDDAMPQRMGGDAPQSSAPVEAVAPSSIEQPASNGSGPRPVIRSEVLERFRNSRPFGPASSPNLPRPGG